MFLICSIMNILQILLTYRPYIIHEWIRLSLVDTFLLISIVRFSVLPLGTWVVISYTNHLCSPSVVPLLVWCISLVVFVRESSIFPITTKGLWLIRLFIIHILCKKTLHPFPLILLSRLDVLRIFDLWLLSIASRNTRYYFVTFK